MRVTTDETEDRITADPDRPGAYVVRVGGAAQSYVDTDDPEHLEFAYMNWLATAFDACVPAGQRARVIHAGGAGMTLARYVAATRPTSPQIVLEPDVELTDEVRREIPLPRNSGIKVRAVDGRTGISAMRADFADVVITDAFVGGRVPSSLSTIEYFEQLGRVLTAGGVALFNVTDRAPFDYCRSYVAGLQHQFAHVTMVSEPAILKGRRFGNIVLASSDSEIPDAAITAAAARAISPFRVTAGDVLSRWINNAVAFTDANPGESPDLLRPQSFRR